MKNRILKRMCFLLVGSLFLVGNLFGQDFKNIEPNKPNKWEWNAGVIFAPQASWDFKTPPTQASSPLFLSTGIVNKKLSLITFYNTSNNNQGVFLGYQLTHKVTIYGVGTKSLSNKSGFMSVGVNTPLGIALGFIEIGTPLGEQMDFDPTLYFGAFIPFTTTLKKW